jgi:hypothetical protein
MVRLIYHTNKSCVGGKTHAPLTEEPVTIEYGGVFVATSICTSCTTDCA